MDKKTKVFDITRLVMGVLAIVLGIILLFVVGIYYNNLLESSAAGAILGLFMLPFILAIMACCIINIILGMLEVKKYIDNKNIPLEDRKLKKGGMFFKMIIAIIGLSLPMIVAYICDINEYNRINKYD